MKSFATVLVLQVVQCQEQFGRRELQWKFNLDDFDKELKELETYLASEQFEKDVDLVVAELPTEQEVDVWFDEQEQLMIQQEEEWQRQQDEKDRRDAERDQDDDRRPDGSRPGGKPSGKKGGKKGGKNRDDSDHDHSDYDSDWEGINPGRQRWNEKNKNEGWNYDEAKQEFDEFFIDKDPEEMDDRAKREFK